MNSPAACNAESPHQPKTVRRKKKNVKVAVPCNRPFGHSGNHAHSTERSARMYEWTQAGEVIR